MIDDAKMGGITPAVLNFNGRCVLCPPYILRPTILFAYWTGIRLCPLSTKTIAPTTQIIRATINAMKKAVSSPVLINLNVFPTADGNPDIIPEKIIREIPFPIPFSVICSPSHMRKDVPAHKVIMVSTLDPKPP